MGIDPQSRNHILDSVRELNRDGMTVLYTSRYMEEVEMLCDRIAIVDHGQVIAEGSVSELQALVGDEDRIRVDLGEAETEVDAASDATAGAALAAVESLHSVSRAEMVGAHAGTAQHPTPGRSWATSSRGSRPLGATFGRSRSSSPTWSLCSFT